jgi:acyl dehydratase
MTTYLHTPTDLLERAGQDLGTTDWMKITQQQVDLFADASGDHQWIHPDPARAANPVRVGSQIRATATVTHAQQKTSGVEAVFTPTYEIDGEKRPACLADVIVLNS